MTRLPKAILIVISLAFFSLLLLAIFRSQHNRNIEKQWRRLDVASSNERFDPDVLTQLPEPAIRYFLHALTPGKPLASTVRLRLKGHFHGLDNNKSFPLVASQLLTPEHGFVWEARIRTGIGFISASNYLVDGNRRSHTHYLGLIPATPDGPPAHYINPETSIERMAMDTIFCPASLLPRPGVSWQPVDQNHARVLLTIQKNTISMLLQIAPDGRLVKVIVENMSAAQSSQTQNFPILQLRIISDRTFDATTIPSQFLVRWSDQWVEQGQLASKDYDILELEVIEAWFK